MKKVKISPKPRYDSIPVNKDKNLGKITRSKSLSSPKKDMAPILKYRATKYTKVFVEQANNGSLLITMKLRDSMPKSRWK